MVTLTVKAKDESLFDYLRYESKEDENGCFLFSTVERASEVFARFVLRKLMEEMIKIISPNENKKEILGYVSNDKMLFILKTIENVLLDYFMKEQEFNLEGFMVFRLKRVSGMVKEELENAIEMYYDDGTSNSVYLKKIMESQPSMEAELKLIVEQNSVLKLMGKKNIYLEEEITRFNFSAEDNAISHIVLLAPQRIKVYDPNNQISKETVVILKKLFEEKVQFLREIYIRN